MSISNIKLAAFSLFQWLYICMLGCSVMSDFGDSMDCSLSGSSVYRISQARILEWVAISSSRGSS